MIELGGKGKNQNSKRQVLSSGKNLGVNDGRVPWPLDWNRETRTFDRPGKQPNLETNSGTLTSPSLWGYLWEALKPVKTPQTPQAPWSIGFDALLSEAEIETQQGCYDKAETHYRKAIVLTKGDVPSYKSLLCRVQATCSLASLLAHRERGAEAERLLIEEVNSIEEFSEQSPVLASLYHHLGMLYRSLGQPTEAVQMFDQALGLLPSDKAHEQRAAAFMGRGIASADMQDHAVAAHSFLMVNRELDVASLSPSKRKLEAKICASASLLRNNDFITAEAVCREAIEMWDIIGGEGIRSAGLWNMLGFAHARNNNLSDAIKAYRMALQVLSDSSLNCPNELADAHFNLALLYVASQQSDEADKHLRRAADAVDAESRAMQSKEAHFRRVFLQYFHSEQPSIGSRELSDSLLFSHPIQSSS